MMEKSRSKLLFVSALLLLMHAAPVALGSVLVYANFDADGLSAYLPFGSTLLVADDITLAGTERELDHYDFAVHAPDASGYYSVWFGLWTDSNGLPDAPIPGTSGSIPVPYGSVSVDCSPDSGAILPDKVWMVLQVEDSNAGWIITEAAELGFTNDIHAMYDGFTWTTSSFGGWPYAGFRAHIWCKGEGGVKWSQPPVLWSEPNTYVGWDEESHNYQPPMVLDDFLCSSDEPITAIRWWGSLRAWDQNVVPDELPDAFHLTIWTDKPAGEPCEPEPEIKWVQWPDLNDDGMDVDASYCQIIGDDFPCNQNGPITDIHIWASWRLDEAPDGDANLVDFRLSIYSDNPVGPYGWSEPNQLLWWQDFASDEFDVSLYAWGLYEGWYSPCSDVYDSFSDTQCWQYDFYIDPCGAFIQQGDTSDPVTYWLVIEATPHDESSYFGVKTRDYYDGHYKDDAVWSLPDDEDWQELRYPRGHQFFDESIDLAFAITTANEPEQTYSHPNEIVWQNYCYSYDVNFYGWEYDPRSGDTGLAKFEFYQEIFYLDWWHQPDDDGIYWLGIRAIYNDVTEEPNYPWGWETRPHFFMDDAVRLLLEPDPGIQYPAEAFEPIEFDSNSWDLSFELIGKPPGDHCYDPVLVTLGPNDLPYVNTNFTCARDNDYNDTCLGYFDEGEDIIYELNVTEAMDVNVTLDPGITINTGIALDDSCPPDNPCMKRSTSTLAEPHGFCVHLEPGTYYIMVDTWPAPFCMSDFTLTIDDGGPSPANDNCNNAELVGDVVDLPFDTTCASFDGNGICMYSPNIWYCYTATCTGFVTVSLCGSSYDTMLAVYNGCDCYPASSDLIECNDDHDCNGVSSWQSQISFHVAASSDYLIEVGGFGSNTGQGLLSISCCPAPANDDCNDAEPVSDVADLPFDTTCATTDGSSPCVLGANIWYCYTATCTGDVTVSLCGSSFDTMLAVYDDCNCYPGAGDVIACNDDFPCPDGNLYRSEANFPAIAGNDYLIEVGGWSGKTGPGLLSIWCDGEALDFGDAPDPCYPTLLANDGARHVIGGPYFCDVGSGDAPDPEGDGQPDATATGDDGDGNDDEDGVSFPVLVQGQPGIVSLNVCGGGGVVDIWIDYNGDGDWDDAGEFEFSSYLGDGPNTVVVNPPPDSVIGQTFARCRITSIGARIPTGQADDGEVEDHMVEIEQIDCLSISAPEYVDWVSLGRPDCWCYPRQCRGDIDGIQTGPFHVAIPDLALFKPCFNQMVIPPGCECADLDHLQTGPFRVAIPDLAIFKTYFNAFVVPLCDQPPIYTGPYNFWTSP
ncbi:MAG: DUF7901 domain-containing protein [Planctomycetota bacterium]|jgi:hypothetical protein